MFLEELLGKVFQVAFREWNTRFSSDGKGVCYLYIVSKGKEKRNNHIRLEDILTINFPKIKAQTFSTVIMNYLHEGRVIVTDPARLLVRPPTFTRA